jgi:hypothetical protein
VCLIFVGTDVNHKASICDYLSFGHCLAWDEKKCVGTFNPASNTLCQSSKFICCCFVPDGKCTIILDEVAIFEAGDSVLIGYRIGHGHGLRGLFEGKSNSLVVCKGNGAEHAWGKSVSLIGRVLACYGSSVVPGDGWCFHMFFFKSVKQVHTSHALWHIWRIVGSWGG